MIATTWKPIKIDGPAKPKVTPAEERSRDLAKKRERAAEAARTPASKDRALDAFLTPLECLINGRDDADLGIFQGMRPKCLEKHGEHVCVLAGPTPEGQRDPAHPWAPPVPPRPRHANDHRCPCGATWS